MNRFEKFGLSLVFLLAVGCSDTGLDTVRSPLAVDGPWAPPAEVVAEAESYDITFVSAGPWVGTDGCSGSFTDGGQVFKEWISSHWPQVEHIGGYACRPIRGNSSTMSVHATGRAVDIHIPLDGGEADNGLGDPLANWLLLHADEIGIQSIIWDRWIWSPSRDPRSRPYTGSHAHHDHLHIELTPEASRLETPWFQGEMGPPDLGGCDEPLPADGGVIDDSDDCFQAFGSAEYWRRVEGDGVDGSLLWTNAFESESPSNWARWRLNVGQAGEYRVDYHNVPEYALFDSARYTVKFAGQTEDVYVDLSAAGEGWQTLGTWTFEAGEGQWVAVHDDHPGPVADGQHVLADAVRLVPVGRETIDDVLVPDPEVATEEPTVSDEQPATSGEDFGYPDSVVARGGCSVPGGRPGPATILSGLLFLGWGRSRRRR